MGVITEVLAGRHNRPDLCVKRMSLGLEILGRKGSSRPLTSTEQIEDNARLCGRQTEEGALSGRIMTSARPLTVNPAHQ